MSEKKNISDAEAIILRLLWKEKELLSVSEINEKLEQKQIKWAYTTVATFLKRMQKKKVVRVIKKGRAYYYQAIVNNNEVISGAAAYINKYFQGSLKNFLISFEANGDMTQQQIEDVKQWINQF